MVGDIAGSTFECANVKTKDFPIIAPGSRFTDDTVMTVAVAAGLMAGGTPGDFVDMMRRTGRQHPRAGYGGTFAKWLSSADRGPYGSWGNGSAMRVSPCAWFGQSLEETWPSGVRP